MDILSKQLRRRLFDTISNSGSFLGLYEEYDNVLTFLNKIWPLKEMPSEDVRFDNAYDDIVQHYINNNDWTIEYIFIERLKLIEGDEKFFIKFLDVVVNPTVRKNKDEITLFVYRINTELQAINYKLVLTDYFEELPIYRFKDSTTTSDLPIDIIPNKIPIYLKEEYLDMQKIEYPCFMITYVNWNDYGLITMVDLDLHKDKHTVVSIGLAKIMKQGCIKTWDEFQEVFTSLPYDFCSLGQSKKYYYNLKRELSSNYYSFLLGIRDVAMFPRIYEQFEDDGIFKQSLIRNNDAEQLARQIRFEIENTNYDEYFKFNYTYKLPYAQNDITLNFNFQYNTDFEHRIYAIIGKNGTGKTKILSSLAKSLSEKDPIAFSPRKPVYGKIFTVSYSFFDTFEIPSSNASFNYVYCGLKKSNNTWKTEEDMLTNFYKSADLIKSKELEIDWYKILINFIPPEILNLTFEKSSLSSNFGFIAANFPKVKRILSSGQSIMLYLTTEILSQIRYDSLILFDEPETHLHPNAISSLLNTLFDLTQKFKSFCVIATHSPLIVQELPARNIFVIEREDDAAFVRGLERESLGENLTIITQEIFGNRDVPKHFISVIKTLVEKGKSYDEIVSILESEQLPISSNIRLYIQTLSSQR